MGTKTKIFTSATLGAPVLSGTPGALIAMLDAVLVNGYGTTSVVSIVVAAGVATVNFSAGHPFAVDQVMQVIGAVPAALNGEQRVLAVNANSVTFATAVAAGNATGTMTAKVAGAGWLKAFSGTNLAAYKSSSVEGTGCFLRVDDTGTTTARVRGFESMTDVNTGSGLFPSVAQFASGLWASKSNAANAAARPWQIFASDRSFYFCPKPMDAGAEHQVSFFGDFKSYKSNDPYSCAIRGNTADRSASSGPLTDDLSYADFVNTTPGLFVARAANAVGGSAAQSSTINAILGYQAGVTPLGSTGFAYPSPIDNGLSLASLVLYNAAGVRGEFPGVYASPQNVTAAFSSGDKIAGTGNLAGKSVEAVKTFTLNAANQSILFFDFLSDWY